MHEKNEVEKDLRKEAERISVKYNGAETIIIVAGNKKAKLDRCMTGSSMHRGFRLRDFLGILQAAIQIESHKHLSPDMEYVIMKHVLIKHITANMENPDEERKYFLIDKSFVLFKEFVVNFIPTPGMEIVIGKIREKLKEIKYSTDSKTLYCYAETFDISEDYGSGFDAPTGMPEEDRAECLKNYLKEGWELNGKNNKF